MEKWKRETFENKEAKELANSGNHHVEQKTGASPSEMFEQMLLDGSITQLLKLKAGGQKAAIDLETALERTQKHPNLIEMVDIEEANTFIESMKEKLNKRIEEEKALEKLKIELTEQQQGQMLTPETKKD